jgi:hypothetical protein
MQSEMGRQSSAAWGFTNAYPRSNAPGGHYNPSDVSSVGMRCELKRFI